MQSIETVTLAQSYILYADPSYIGVRQTAFAGGISQLRFKSCKNGFRCESDTVRNGKGMMHRFPANKPRMNPLKTQKYWNPGPFTVNPQGPCGFCPRYLVGTFMGSTRKNHICLGILTNTAHIIS